jgi:hypothetical protein
MPDELPSIPPPTAPPDAREAEWLRLFAQASPDETGPLPPEVVATPGHVRPGPSGEITWWRPGWGDMWRHVGWRWVFLLPTLLFLLLLVPSLRRFHAAFLVLEVKLLVSMGAVALTLAGYVFRRAAKARREPFCIFCGYNLTGLPDNYRCPECGRPYTWRLIAEYRRDPQWFIERYRAQRRLPPADQPFAAGPVRRRRRDGTCGGRLRGGGSDNLDDHRVPARGA